MKSKHSAKPVIFKFGNDLRLHDHIGLQAALATGRPLLAVYILDDVNAGDEKTGAAGRWWLHHSLTALQNSLRAMGGDLCLRRGDSVDVLKELLAKTGAEAVYSSRSYEPWAVELEKRIDREFAGKTEIRRFSGSLLFEPETIKTKTGSPFKVFTPFWKNCLQMPEPDGCLQAPDAIDFYTPYPFSEPLADWRLTPQGVNWAEGFRQYWRPGEQGGLEALESFLQAGLGDYANDRDRPDREGTSRLSPHLHFGEISPRRVWLAVKMKSVLQSGSMQAAECFLRELGWREFCHYLLCYWPELITQPFKSHFENFPWQADQDLLQAWREGQTGYPVVDAGMKELWHSGWMHNRVRMIAASFLTKDLLQPWQSGEAWFRETLVDADLANNIGGWQWVAGCGVDAAPYFRVFNPVTQGKKFDPEGLYVKKWLPQLAGLPPHYRHEPWNAPEVVLQEAGIVLGRDYPRPVVDHGQARKKALEAFSEIQRKSG